MHAEWTYRVFVVQRLFDLTGGNYSSPTLHPPLQARFG